MKIAKHTVASVTYALEVEGEPIEKADNTNPLVFLVGVEAMIPGFEKQLMGLSVGDSYDIKVSPEEGYGEVNPQAVVDLPKDVFTVNGELQEDLLEIGRAIPLQDRDGNTMQGIVLEVKDEAVTMDFNHQFSGKELAFKGEILDVRDATTEEIESRQVQ